MVGTTPPADETATVNALLAGWGGRCASRPERLVSYEALVSTLDEAPGRGLVARGMGRSYGDSAQRAGGTVVDMMSQPGAVMIDSSGRARVSASTTIEQLLVAAVPMGWFVPTTPGTRLVSIGGAVAADVHGKNHHADGSFGSHVLSLRLRAPGGELQLTPADDAFWATVGGMGLTGVITEVEVQLTPIRSSRMVVDTVRARDLDALMAVMADGDQRWRYSVAWIDLLATGASMGRGVLSAGDHAPSGELRYEPVARLHAPPTPVGLTTAAAMRAFNSMWFRVSRPSSARPSSIDSFFYPLDGVGRWNRLYGPAGFLQHQFVVPFGAEAVLRQIVERLSLAGVGSFLAVLKRFGPANSGHLSFPMPGWTLALDLAARGAGLDALLGRLDAMVVECGGRTYFAKDARVDPRLVPEMYPRLREWRTVRDRLDPERRMRSDLSERLGLIGDL